MKAIRQWLTGFRPAPSTASRSEQLLGAMGALAGLGLTAWLSQWVLGTVEPWLVAPMGASAVLLFAVPSSPLAQPWSMLGGNLIAGLVGVACARALGPTGLSAALAVSASIGAMFALRCLHPPGGAVALTAVLGGDPVTRLGYEFVLHPLAFNCMLLLLVALVFNNAFRRRYPHRPSRPATAPGGDPAPRYRLGFTPADLDAVLRERGDLLDIARDDLEQVLRATEARVFQRRFGEVRCETIMSRQLLTLSPDTAPADALATLRLHRLSALPVTDRSGHLLGMLSLEQLLDRSGEASIEPLLRQARVCRREWPVTYLVDLLARAPDHRAPVVDEHNRLIGIVSQTDLVAALLRVALERG